MLEIISNGSKWAGQEPDSIKELIEALKEYPLDPIFEKYGNFINPNPQFLKAEAQEKYAGCTSFWGNFHTVSHGFNIFTDEPEVIEMLSAAIRANLSTKAYKQARREYMADVKQREQEQKRALQLRRAN